MKVGDLVCWGSVGIPLGIVIEATKEWKHGGIQAVRVQWANGVTSNHSTSWLRLIETSENT